MTFSAKGTKVLHLITGEFYAGAERVQDLLAAGLGRHGYEVGFACLKNGIFAEKRRHREAPLHAFPMQSRIDLGLSLRLSKLVRREGYRLLHTHTPRSALVGQLVSWMSRVPMVHHIHSPAERDTESGWRNAANSLVERLSLRGARRLIAVSESLEQLLVSRGVDPGRIVQVPNGVPLCERLRLGYRNGEPLEVGMVALFRPRKGVEVLLQAMALLRDEGLPVRLRAVGPFETPDYERSVRELSARLGLEAQVTWCGFTSDINAGFARMHVFALPSLFGEGMPMVVLEAMAAGLPVISTRVEGIPQVVRQGQDGLLVEAGDARQLADALRRCIRGEVDIASLGDSGRQRQRENFSDESMAAKVAAVYREVLAA
ncbi:MAG: glycosyltransferase [Steroidobacteraceae bacterium]